MAPAPQLSDPGTATYQSDTMSVGDGTWDFGKNTFLLPNLVGPNYETMRYNGMGNRFSTAAQYHRLVLAHALLGAFAFLVFVPAGVFYARFYSKRPDHIVRNHARCQLVAGILLLAAFVLGNFVVGPSRALSNPHHGIGVAVFLLFILQLIGGRMIRHITKSVSLRIKIHQWFGRSTAALGIIQVPLGLTLYGSPLYLFILFALWMAFLVFLYFVMDHRRDHHRDGTVIRGHSVRDSRGSRGSRVTDSAYVTDITEKTEPKSERGLPRWLVPLGAGAGIWALLRNRNKGDDRSRRDRSRSRSRSTRTGGGRYPEVLPSRRGSVYESEYTDRTGYTDTTRYTGRDGRRGEEKGGRGFGRTLLGIGAAFGAQKLLSSWLTRREGHKREQAYSEVSTATPTATPRRHGGRQPRTVTTISDATTTTTTTTDDSTFPPAGDRTALAGAYGAGSPPTRREANPPREPPRREPPRRDASRPRTPRPSHARARSAVESRDSWEESELTGTPSRRRQPPKPKSETKGILGMLGMGWLAGRLAGNGNGNEDRDREKGGSGHLDDYSDYDDHRSAARSRHATRYTGDPPSSPRAPRTSSRRRTRRYSNAPAPAPAPASPSALTASAPAAKAPPTLSDLSDTTSMVEQPPPPPRPRFTGPPMPPLVAGAVPGQPLPPPPPGPQRDSVAGTARRDEPEHVSMPAMPPDPHGVLYYDDSSPGSPSRTTAERRRSRRRRAGDQATTAAAAAVASASVLAAEEDRRRRDDAERRAATAVAASTPPRSNVHIKMHVHDDRDRNITFRRMTDEELADKARHRSSSVSSSDEDTPSTRRGYRRDSTSIRRAEDVAQQKATGTESQVTPTPTQVPASRPSAAGPGPSVPTPVASAAAAGRKKDSAYWSGQTGATAGPSGLHPAPGPGTTVSSLATSESHAQESSAMGSAADRRSRRRQERRRADDSSLSRTADPQDMFS